MSFFKNWFYNQRTIGCPDTKSSTILEELYFMRADKREYSDALAALVGPDWEKVPTRSMMDLVTFRLRAKVANFYDLEVASVMRLLKSCAQDLSRDQIKFLRDNDHLPLTRKDHGIWMDAEELASYAKRQEDIHEIKMGYFIMSHGILTAHSQMNSGKKVDKPKKPFKLSALHMVLISAVLLGVILFVIL